MKTSQQANSERKNSAYSMGYNHGYFGKPKVKNLVSRLSIYEKGFSDGTNKRLSKNEK